MSLISNVRRYCTSSAWNIGFVEDGIQHVIQENSLNVHWLKHQYKDRWFADPFILDVDDENITLLVEEFSYALNKGRIAKLIVARKNYILKEMKIILEESWHLSFPFILRKNDKIYIIPESCRATTAAVYEYDPVTDFITKNNDLSHLPLTDATILNWDNKKYYLLSTKLPSPNNGVLYLFDFDYDKMVIDDEPTQRVLFKGEIARNAGESFVVDDIYYRPAQDCKKNYGNGIVIQRIESINDRLLFSEIKTFFSTYRKMDLGYHTFNMRNGLIVIDGHGHRRKLLYTIYRVLTNFKNLWKNK